MDVIGSDGFSVKLAEALGARHIPVKHRVFPDGESCPRLMGRPESGAVIAERMSLPIHPNRYFTGLLLTIKNIMAMKSEGISVVMPYFIYSRQDRSYSPGEPFSAKHVLEMLHDMGVSRFFTVSSHMERFKPMLTAPMPAHNIDGYSILGEGLKGLKLRDAVVMGPDMSISMAAQRVASMLGTESISMEKHRDLDTGRLSVAGLKKSFGGRDVIIVDDIISSGSTMLKAIEAAENGGCGKVVIATVHAVQQKGLELLKKRAWKIIATDTVGTPASSVSVIGRLADAIKRHSGGGPWAAGGSAHSAEYGARKPYSYAHGNNAHNADEYGNDACDEDVGSGEGSTEIAEGAFSMFG